MSKFLSPLLLRAYSADELAAAKLTAQNYELLEDFAYQSDVVGAVITVPKGLVTDFASIPRVVWGILDPEDPVILFPSVVHDYLYTVAGAVPGLAVPVTRETADQVMREAMGICGASWLQRVEVFDAIRLGGGSHWGT